MVHRVATVDMDYCNPKKCGLECIKFCPVNKMGGECIILGEHGKALINENLCTGCGVCIHKCPFKAINIINLPEELKKDKVHQYGANTFRLYRLPRLKKGAVIGLVGRNGIGKTTALNILSGNLKPNLGRFENPPNWDEIIDNFGGTELKEHFQRIANGDLKVSIKPQAVYDIPKVWNGDARSLLERYDERGISSKLEKRLGLDKSLDKPVPELSGGELQRLAVAVAVSRDAELYLFDEPSSYNDVYQRLEVARVIHELAQENKYVLIVEHDLTLLDYLSDFIHILYGEPGAYGIVSNIQPSRTGINTLLDGYLPGENVRFRDKPVRFDVYAPIAKEIDTPIVAEYTDIVKNYPGFELKVKAGRLRQGEVVGILGANALGKTTFMKIVAGLEKADVGEVRLGAKISYKPQYLSGDFEGSVFEILKEVAGDRLNNSLVQEQIILPLGLHRLMDRKVKNLSGGELQKLAIATCLLREADIYALDEPSAFIDVEDRIALAKIIQRFVKSQGKSALIVDHDIQIIDIVSDTLMIFSGSSGVYGEATPPLPKGEGMNVFLESLGITYRRDTDTGRPRVNKPGSKLDKKQKELKEFYYMKIIKEGG
ncbi:MAG: ribosome biogenesis/translation initiation ATPase RLI [Nitrososphaerota archaeon]|nr:ribosome biogenesis/translation initiation ATPase RLI [Nitrososphaerales archaeon]MDW8044208.1 ribosome biogenesis/translation initiation ATPase RLI [Nitrososphaerota archaeon]